MPVDKAIAFWDELEAEGRKNGSLNQVVRMLVLADLAYLLIRVCGRVDLLPCVNRPGFIDNQFCWDRIREVQREPNEYCDLWAREHGKDLADDTPMLTANRGWTTHGELEVGDQVFAPNGKAVPVVALSERYTASECYRVTFSDGAQIVAGAGHLWKLRVKHKNRIANSDIRRVTFSEQIVTTEQLTGDERCDVGVASALEMPVQQLEIDPYVLGAWLGDGTSSKPQITCSDADVELIERLRSKGYEVTEMTYGRQANCSLYSINPGIRGKRGTGFGAVLRRMGLLNNKHIPDQYMRSSIHQRMELLRGLMDTDGHCNPRGTATFSGVNERLVSQVYDLAASLGLRPRFRHHFMKVNDAPYPVWSVSFQSHRDRNAFALSRKAALAIDKYLHRDTRLIHEVTPIPSVPTRCIQVQGGMYLAGKQLVPTHNSSIISFGLTLQNVLQDPEITIGIFSFTRPQAKAFLRTLMREIENNAALHAAFPDILVGKDVRLYPKFSEDDGVLVKRKSNPAEATIEAYGLEALPVGRHFKVLIFDDIVVPASVTTTEQVAKTLENLQHSYNLGSAGGHRRMIGTRYSYADAYGTVIKNGTFKAREYPGKKGGTEDGESVLWDEETHQKKRSEQGQWIYGSQILLDPRADAQQGFQRDWLRYYKTITESQAKAMTKYILVDSASSKKKNSDFTAMWVIGLGADGNYYALDMVRDRLNLKERGDRLFDLHRKWKPIQVRHERYGLLSDTEHYAQRMEQESYRFTITEVAGQTSKADRIKRLIPLFENGRIWLPRSKNVTDWQKIVVDLVHEFVESEFFPFPGALHDDMLDSLARICEPDLRLIWPKEEKSKPPPPPRSLPNASVAWMA